MRTMRKTTGMASFEPSYIASICIQHMDFGEVEA